MKPDGKKEMRSSTVPMGRSDGAALSADEPEPRAEFGHAPVWLIILFALFFYWGQLYLDEHGGGFHPQVYEPYASYKQVSDLNPKGGAAAMIAKGEALYQLKGCSACHQLSGQGVPGQFPPLAGSEWVLEAVPSRLIRIPLNGLSGPITVKGQEWNSQMLALGATMPDNEDLAAILTYIRQAWGNTAPPVTPEQVEAVRKELAGRSEDNTAPWSTADLLKVSVSP